MYTCLKLSYINHYIKYFNFQRNIYPMLGVFKLIITVFNDIFNTAILGPSENIRGVVQLNRDSGIHLRTE